jgi:hypothetical protein
MESAVDYSYTRVAAEEALLQELRLQRRQLRRAYSATKQEKRHRIESISSYVILTPSTLIVFQAPAEGCFSCGAFTRVHLLFDNVFDGKRTLSCIYTNALVMMYFRQDEGKSPLCFHVLPYFWSISLSKYCPHKLHKEIL